LVAHPFDDREEIASLLSQRFNRKIEILYPQKGSKAKLTKLAITNANEVLKLDTKSYSNIEAEMAELFELTTTPFRVESFDNSHMMGVATVGAMVVWNENRWDKSSYRRYSLNAKDEYGQMREMLSRRIDSFSQNSPPE